MIEAYKRDLGRLQAENARLRKAAAKRASAPPAPLHQVERGAKRRGEEPAQAVADDEREG